MLVLDDPLTLQTYNNKMSNPALFPVHAARENFAKF